MPENKKTLQTRISVRIDMDDRGVLADEAGRLGVKESEILRTAIAEKANKVRRTAKRETASN